MKTISKAAVLMLGVDADHIDEMQRKINALERENDAIALTRVRHEISEKLVEIRLLLRDGHTKNMSGHKCPDCDGGTTCGAVNCGGLI